MTLRFSVRNSESFVSFDYFFSCQKFINFPLSFLNLISLVSLLFNLTKSRRRLAQSSASIHFQLLFTFLNQMIFSLTFLACFKYFFKFLFTHSNSLQRKLFFNTKFEFIFTIFHNNFWYFLKYFVEYRNPEKIIQRISIVSQDWVMCMCCAIT